MTANGIESSHSDTTKVVTCHICGKTVKDYRLSSHLLFGSLQCKECSVKFRYCKDFYAFRKSKESKKSQSCEHRTLKWTRDPAEYLERKVKNEIAESKTQEDHPPSSKEVTYALISYLSKLKPIEHRTPWKYAVEKLQRHVSKQSSSRCHERKERNSSYAGHRHGRDKHSHRSRNESQYLEDGHDRKENENGYQHSTNSSDHEIPTFEDSLGFYPNDNATELEDVQNGFENNCNGEMIPQSVEEVIIPQSEWEIDVVSFNEFEESDKSVDIFLGSGTDYNYPFVVEEVCITKHDDDGVATLIIDNVDSATETEVSSSEYDGSVSSFGTTENSIAVSDKCMKLSEDEQEVIEPCEMNVDKAVLSNEYFEENVIPEQCFDDKDEYNEKTRAPKLENEDESFTEEDYYEKQVSKEKARALFKVFEHRKLDYSETMHSERERKDTFKNGYLPSRLIDDQNSQSIVRNGNDLSKYESRQKHYSSEDKRKSKKQRGDKKDKRKSHRLKSSLRKRTVAADNTKENEGHHNGTNGNALMPTKYNLRSRRSHVSNSFLQKLDAYEKKKLWDKLAPTARKLRLLKAKHNEDSVSDLCLPIDCEGNEDDDFFVDILLSQMLDIHKLNKLAFMSSSESDDEAEFLFESVKKAIKQLSVSVDRPCMGGAVCPSELPVNGCIKNDSFRKAIPNKSSTRMKQWNHVKAKKREKSKSTRLDCMIFGKESPKRKIIYVNPPPDGKYYVVTYPSQPFITECPMCYFRVFPAMFSLNLVTNLATTRCVGCALTIYVVQEPDACNSFPKIVFRKEPISLEDPLLPKPARYKRFGKSKAKKKLSAKNFFKQ